MRIPHKLLDVNGRTVVVGPWPCEACHYQTQYAEVTTKVNRVFCRNENCRVERIIDKRRHRIVESDGTVWAFDSAGNKWRVRS